MNEELLTKLLQVMIISIIKVAYYIMPEEKKKTHGMKYPNI
jgi:hypothetical protein